MTEERSIEKVVVLSETLQTVNQQNNVQNSNYLYTINILSTLGR
jgi:hypothetical protein